MDSQQIFDLISNVIGAISIIGLAILVILFIIDTIKKE